MKTTGYIRKNGIIQNTEIRDYEAYVEKRNLIIENKNNQKKINSLEKDLSQIKELLIKLTGNS